MSPEMNNCQAVSQILRVLSTENPKVLIRECTVQESWTGSSAVGNPFRKMGAQITFNVL